MANDDDLQAWIALLQEALDLERHDVDTTAVLDVAREAAHAVTRPAAPLATMLLGLAIGQGMDPHTAAARIRRCARNWGKTNGQGQALA